MSARETHPFSTNMLEDLKVVILDHIIIYIHTYITLTTVPHVVDGKIFIRHGEQQTTSHRKHVEEKATWSPNKQYNIWVYYLVVVHGGDVAVRIVVRPHSVVDERTVWVVDGGDVFESAFHHEVVFRMPESGPKPVVTEDDTIVPPNR